ncbi:PAS domain-containing hybrid sensor histidine kinase/response regulator [Desulforhabdus amnigena]|uniref:histidine kinase n=1 Tax=Desulforhabdus amnigena TaxID=40218 RepID=A0A9W6FTI8_9BACT|nr:PAS domain-containing hybrid sensor histidine kinase/response regulator [Desulforhabdus amnigena]GLI34010.1 hypothetical protein DAMNIGENAA_14430 [Desulforhabdus amnigena]
MDCLPKGVIEMGLKRFESLREDMTQILGMIQRFEEVLSGEQGLESTCRGFAQVIIEESSFENCSILVWDHKKGALSTAGGFSLEDLLDEKPPSNGDGHLTCALLEDLAEKTYSTQKAVFIEEVKDSFLVGTNLIFRPVSVACLPLLEVGVMTLSTRHPTHFSTPFKRNWEILSRLIGHILLGVCHRGGLRSEGAVVQEPPPPIRLVERTVSKDGFPLERSSMLERAIHLAPQGICLLDPEGSVVQINASLQRLHGESATEIIGRSPAVLFQDSSIWGKILKKMEGSEQEELTDISLINCEGKVYLADVHLVRLSDDQGAVNGYLLMITDMTKKKAFAEKILQTEKLVALGTMAGGVAHDFNNLLMAVLGHIQLLLLHTTDGDVRSRLQNIEKAVHDGSHTIRRLQKFTERDRETRGALNAVDVAEAVQDVVELTRPKWKNGMEKYGHTVQFQMELETNCVAAIHASDLREVLTNLVFNAIDALPEGGTITLRCKSVKDSVVIEVADNGIGMSKEVVSKIFDPYYTTKGVGNSGLGLSVSWSLVVRCGGEIQVKSKPGKGTVFIITLPKGETARKVISDSKRNGTDRSHRILVLDDDQEILGILRDMIRLKGHKVTATDDGKKALELIQEQDFDLVLTDLGMPEISGWEVAREVKSKNPQVPVILITGWGTQYEDEDLSDRGVDLVLSKPFSWERLLDAIGKMLSLS